MEHPLPWITEEKQQMQEKTPSKKSTSAEQGTSLKGTWSDKKEIAKGDGMETDHPH
jgi:hypothetical protein